MIAIYLDSSERFLFVSDDLWLCLTGCKLLSSKLNMAICEIPTKQKIDNENCLNYTLSKKERAIYSQDIHHPRLLRFEIDNIREADQLSKDERELLITHQQFCIFVLNVLKAAWTTDALLNNGDRKFFQDLIGMTEVCSEHDDTGLTDGFLKNIYRILYLGFDRNTILDSIKDLFDNSNSKLPRNLEIYKNVFYRNLEI